METKILQRPKRPQEFLVMNEYVYGEKNKEYSNGDLARRLLEEMI